MKYRKNSQFSQQHPKCQEIDEMSAFSNNTIPNTISIDYLADDDYQAALLGDTGLATLTHPNIPLQYLFPELALANKTVEDRTNETVTAQKSFGPLSYLTFLLLKAGKTAA